MSDLLRMCVQFSELTSHISTSEHVAQIWRKIGLFRTKNRIYDSFGATKCLQQIKLPDLLHICAPCTELPSHISTLDKGYKNNCTRTAFLWHVQVCRIILIVYYTAQIQRKFSSAILKVENWKVAPDQVQISGTFHSMKSKLTQFIFYVTICTNWPLHLDM